MYREYYLITVFLVFVPLSFSSAQIKSDIQTGDNHLSQYEHKEDNLSNFPFQFGLSVGRAITLKPKNYFDLYISAYTNLNLTHKILFLRAEYGSLVANTELGGTLWFLLLGFNVCPLKFDRSSIAFDCGFGVYYGDYVRGGRFSAGLKYIYSFNRYFGLTGSFRFPFIGRSEDSDFYHNPFLALGIQFFTY